MTLYNDHPRAPGTFSAARTKTLYLENAEISQQLADAQTQRDQFRAAIVAHRAAQRTDPCWENDVQLWQALGDGDTDPNHLYASPEAMLEGCKVYVQGCFKPKAKPNDHDLHDRPGS
jgi:hypothetical protein